MNLQDRIDNYVKETKLPRVLFVGEDGRLSVLLLWEITTE